MLKFANTNSLIRIFLIEKKNPCHSLFDGFYITLELCQRLFDERTCLFPDIQIYDKTGHSKHNG